MRDGSGTTCSGRGVLKFETTAAPDLKGSRDYPWHTRAPFILARDARCATSYFFTGTYLRAVA